MRLSPAETATSSLTTPSVPEAGPRPATDADYVPTWAWMRIEFDCLKREMSPSTVILISDKRHISQARKLFPDDILWHRKEIKQFVDLMESHGLDEDMFVKVNRVKKHMGAWFLGLEKDVALVGRNDGKRWRRRVQ